MILISKTRGLGEASNLSHADVFVDESLTGPIADGWVHVVLGERNVVTNQ